MPDSLLPPAVAADMIQFHVLTGFPPHNVNRDEDGRPKTCQLGGAVRGRISSQAKKRALRFAPHFPAARRATRTREAGIHTFRRLAAAGIDDAFAAWAALAVNAATGVGGSPTLEEAQKLTGGEGRGKKKKAAAAAPAAATPAEEAVPLDRAGLERALRTEQGLVISTREFARIEEGIERLATAWEEDRDGFADVLAAWVKAVCKDSLLTRDDHDLDTALFGRMVAADPGFNVEAACAVSHAFTTHAFTTEGDYFSAGEELNILGGTGAAITAYAFFGGGVYYQHAVLDRTSLRETLSQGRSPEEAAALTEQAVDAFLRGLVFAQPRGKRNSHASDVAAAYVLVTSGGDPAMNLGLAFLEPVKATATEPDVMRASITRLREFQRLAAASYGLTNRVCAFNAYPPAQGGDAPAAAGEVRTYEALRRFVLGTGA